MAYERTTALPSNGMLARGGVIGGLIGGMGMAMLMMVVTGLSGMGFLRPLYLLAATFNPQWAMTQGVDMVAILVGLMLHMMNSAIFGVVFALVLGAWLRQGISTGGWLIAGMVWAVILFAVNQFIVLPIVDPALAQGAGSVAIWWFISHLMYGGLLGAVVASPLGIGTSANPMRTQSA